MKQVQVVTREALDQWNRAHTAVFVDDAFAPLPGGVWVHKLSTATLDNIRQMSRVGVNDDDGLAVEKFERLQLCEALRLGPEPDAAYLYPPHPIQYEQVAELSPGVRRRLVQVVDALLGFDNDERGKLGNYSGGEAFRPGASPGSDVSPAESTNPTTKSGPRTVTSSI
jgi:hypothetical protein